MNLGTAEFDLLLLLLFAVIFVLVGMLWRSVQAGMTQAIAELRVRQDNTDMRLAQLPTGREFNDLRVQMASVEAKQEAVLTETHGARAAIRRVEDFLLKAKRDHDSQF